MKYKIKKEEYQKVVIENYEVNLPEQPIYLFITGIRRAYSVIPELTTWNKKQYQKDEEIYQYKVVEVDCCYGNGVRSYTIAVSNFGDILNNAKNENYRLVQEIIDPEYTTRTKEDFQSDLNRVLDKIKENI